MTREGDGGVSTRAWWPSWGCPPWNGPTVAPNVAALMGHGATFQLVNFPEPPRDSGEADAVHGPTALGLWKGRIPGY